MKYDIVKLDQDITNAENELNRLVDNATEYDKLYEQSVVTDKVIAKYLEAKQYLENEKKKIVKDYSELLKSFPNAQEEELNHFSNNVYVYATLRACNIDEQEIVEQLLYLNNRYFDEMQEDGVVKNTQITNANLEYLQKLNDKYMKLIKQKM